MRFIRRIKRVAVLGCGPAGLFAAHAFHEAGWEVSIFSKKRRSEMFGAQYLHAPIPGLSTTSRMLDYKLQGTVEGYAAKVYGGLVPPEAVSPSRYVGTHEVWDIREAYYAAWDYHASRITPMYLDASSIPSIKQQFDLTVCSLPANDICADMEGRHTFPSETVWAIGDAPERGIFCPVFVPSYTIICNGEPEPGWYRASNVFGYKTAEWPHDKKPPIPDVASVRKPVSTNCNCHLDKKFVRVGRYGTWTKGVLSHEAYQTARELAR